MTNNPYSSLNDALKQRYGEKVYKLTLNIGCSCPNRDGTLGTGGCIFCSKGGSGEFAASPRLSVTEQIRDSKRRLAKKRPAQKYIAYFQAYTNTYAPLEYLRKVFTEAIHHPEIVALSIATRPDCLGEGVLSLLQELNAIKPVWIELGLQTIHEKTASFIRRGYPLSVFDEAIQHLKALQIETIVHIILGLPGETREQMLDTVRYVNKVGADGIKLQLLHILKHTDLADYYEQTSFPVFSLEEYVDMVISCIEICRPDMVIHRITGDGPKDLLIAPLWSSSKRHVLNTIHKEFKRRNTWQGRLYVSS
ncbi:MAG: TIGR01212 family radical SAM protein [Lachnospiraceae bacterium]|jgi:radical SAM protein (TIGR01212 family)|nr:TIGR01212 family radical SAM protein [Lachnospiraceae bacterium]